MRTTAQVMHALTQMRLALGLKQSDVAPDVDRGQQMVSRWETGHSTPTLEQMQAYAGAVGLRLCVQIEEDEQ